MRKDLFNEFITEWNYTHEYKMRIMSNTTAVAEDCYDLWVAENHAFEVEVKHYKLKSTYIYTD